MIPDTPGPHCSRRILEWTLACGLLMFGAHVLVVPGALEDSRMSRVLLLVSQPKFGALCFLVGCVRIHALYRNGSWPVWGPRLRAITALASAAILFQFAVALAQPYRGAPSPAMWFYFALFFGELRSVYRARRDTARPAFSQLKTIFARARRADADGPPPRP